MNDQKPHNDYWQSLLDASGLNPRSLPLAEAMDLFDKLADLPDIAYGYPQGGCEARTHLMCRWLVAQGHIPQKAWIFEQGGPLRYRPPPQDASQHPAKEIKWCYHVAPALMVDTGEAAPQALVFDPSIFDGPVTPDRWREIMSGTADALHLLPLGATPAGCSGDYLPMSKDVRWLAITQTADYTDRYARETMDSNNRFGMTLRRVHSCGLRPPASGRTWRTAPPPKNQPARQLRRE